MVTFDINGAIIEFDEKMDNYNKIRRELKLKAIELSKEFEARCTDNIKSLKQLSDNGLGYGLEYIESAIKKGVETIVRYDVITVDTAIFKEVYCKKYLNYERLFNNLNKHTLSPKRNKKNSYNTVDSLKPLIKKLSEYLYNDCFNIHNAVIDALIENNVDLVSSKIEQESIKKSNALFVCSFSSFRRLRADAIQKRANSYPSIKLRRFTTSKVTPFQRKWNCRIVTRAIAC